MIKPNMRVRHLVSDTAELIKRLELLKANHVKNGVLSGAGSHPNSASGATIASIAAWNEFGTPRNPARPFMRNAYQAFKKEKAFVMQALRTILFSKDGKYLRKNPNVRAFFDVVGLKIQSLMIAQIDNGVPPENAPSTIEKKGSSHTLFDTGILKKSLAYAVVKN